MLEQLRQQVIDARNRLEIASQQYHKNEISAEKLREVSASYDKAYADYYNYKETH